MGLCHFQSTLAARKVRHWEDDMTPYDWREKKRKSAKRHIWPVLSLLFMLVVLGYEVWRRYV